MPEIVTVKITGLDKIEEALERAPLRASRQILRTGLLAAVYIWVGEMKARVRQGPHHAKGKHGVPEYGVIEKSIASRVTVKSDLEGTASVGPGKGTYWASFLEFGTRKMRAFPFIRASFEARKQDVLEEFAIETKAALKAAGLDLK